MQDTIRLSRLSNPRATWLGFVLLIVVFTLFGSVTHDIGDQQHQSAQTFPAHASCGANCP